MSNELSYVKMNYGRHRGNTKVIRFCKIDGNGLISYVEKREMFVKKKIEVMWRLGTIKYLNAPGASTLSSTKEEYDNNFASAIEAIK